MYALQSKTKWIMSRCDPPRVFLASCDARGWPPPLRSAWDTALPCSFVSHAGQASVVRQGSFQSASSFSSTLTLLLASLPDSLSLSLSLLRRLDMGAEIGKPSAADECNADSKHRAACRDQLHKGLLQARKATRKAFKDKIVAANAR